MVPFRTGVVLAFALLAAGCSGLAAPETESPVTPAPVPSATPMAPSGDGPPTAVADTHRAVLSTTNYTVRTEWHVVARDGDTRVRSRHVRRVEAGGRAYSGVYRSRTNAHPVYANNSRHVAYWTNGTAEALDYVETESAPRLYTQIESGPASDLTTAGTIQRLLAGTDATVVERTESGRTVVGATETTRAYVVRKSPYVTDLSDLDLRIVVSSAGVVERWHVTYDARLTSPFDDGESVPVTVVRSGTVTDVGSTAVDRPDWVANATTPATGTTD